MDDVFDLLAQLLTVLAVWLDDRTGPVPWPLVVGSGSLPIVVLLRVALWFARGRLWPVPCSYHHTLQARRDKACRQTVAGEWYYCRHHRSSKRMSNGHRCDPSVPRWQEKRPDGVLVDRADVRGVGFVSLMSNRETLLFYKGVAKRPGDVLRGVPRVHQHFISGLRALRALSWRTVLRPPDGGPRGVAERMPRVVVATRLFLVGLIVGLALVVLSVPLEGGWRRAAQYASTLAFLLAWNLLRFGVWKTPDDEPQWVKTAAKDSCKVVAVLVVVAACGAGVAAMADRQDGQAVSSAMASLSVGRALIR